MPTLSESTEVLVRAARGQRAAYEDGCCEQCDACPLRDEDRGEDDATSCEDGERLHRLDRQVALA